jgi:hypothetical protein
LLLAYTNQSIGPAATAEQAIAMILERLPPGCGAAFVGTPEELSAHESGVESPRTSDQDG